MKDSEKTFTVLICYIERSRSEVTNLIRDQEKAAVSQAEGLLKRLEQEIDDLKRRDAELEQLEHTDDHIHFLQVTLFLKQVFSEIDLQRIFIQFIKLINFFCTYYDVLCFYCILL